MTKIFRLVIVMVAFLLLVVLPFIQEGPTTRNLVCFPLAGCILTANILLGYRYRRGVYRSLSGSQPNRARRLSLLIWVFGAYCLFFGSRGYVGLGWASSFTLCWLFGPETGLLIAKCRNAETSED